MNYRHENGVDQNDIAMAVVVQLMVESDVSGILFTANPATGERSELVINASFGLGEMIVSGKVTPDTYVVDRPTLATREEVIGTKDQLSVAKDSGGTREEAVDGALRIAVLRLWTNNAPNSAAPRLKSSSCSATPRISSGLSLMGSCICCSHARSQIYRFNPSTSIGAFLLQRRTCHVDRLSKTCPIPFVLSLKNSI